MFSTVAIPNKEYISITNPTLVPEFLIQFFKNQGWLASWSHITKQSPNMKIGRVAQMLASLVTGVPGTNTAGRGDDLLDSSEVKECNRLDQADTCLVCRSRVPRRAIACQCGSIKRRYNNDSKWLLTVKDNNRLDSLLSRERFVFVLFEYLNFKGRDWNSIGVSVYEIWPSLARCSRFRDVLTDYYENIFMPSFNRGNPTPASFNFWPHSIKFHLCNPVEIFRCHIHDIQHDQKVVVLNHVDYFADRAKLPSVLTPTDILNGSELQILKSKYPVLPGFVTEEMKSILEIRK